MKPLAYVSHPWRVGQQLMDQNYWDYMPSDWQDVMKSVRETVL